MRVKVIYFSKIIKFSNDILIGFIFNPVFKFIKRNRKKYLIY